MNHQKPFDSYFGGKGSDGTFQQIINTFRPHRRYIEPYAGNATIARYKRPADEMSILNDINNSVYERLNEAFHNAEKFTVKNFEALELLRFELNYQLICPYRMLIYCDPPHPPSTRKSSKRYKDEMTEEQHKALLELLLRFECDIVISTRPNELYAEMLKDWKRIEFQSRQRIGSATEWVFMNYQTIDELHEYTYLGKDFRERQLIKKKVNRWTENFKQLPALQQKMMIAELSKTL